MPTLLIHDRSEAAPRWAEALSRRMPELVVRVWPRVGPPEEIAYALVWRPPDDTLHRLPALRAVFALGAGVDHLLGGAMPASVPLVRMVTPDLTRGMVEYVVYHVLRHHRHMPVYERQQAREEWRGHGQMPAGGRAVGVLGLGELGGACARALRDLGFDVAGYARRAHAIDGVTAFDATTGLDAFLARSDMLVNLLPLTPRTRGILDHRLFQRLPHGAVLINAARGEHLVEEDLLIALGEGRLAHAVLDAFATEPLPAGHPFWRHPHITVTPHIASLPQPETGALHVIASIRRDLAGEPLRHAVDRGRGY